AADIAPPRRRPEPIDAGDPRRATIGHCKWTVERRQSAFQRVRTETRPRGVGHRPEDRATMDGAVAQQGKVLRFPASRPDPGRSCAATGTMNERGMPMLRIAGFLLWGCLFSMLAASCRTTPTEPQAPEAQGKAMNTTSAEDWVLLPRPRQMEITGMFRLSQWGAPSFHGDVSAETRNELAQALEGFPLDREDGGSTSSAVPVRIAVDPAEVPHA